SHLRCPAPSRPFAAIKPEVRFRVMAFGLISLALCRGVKRTTLGPRPGRATRRGAHAIGLGPAPYRLAAPRAALCCPHAAPFDLGCLPLTAVLYACASV